MQLPLMSAGDARYCVWRAGREYCLPLEQVAEVAAFPLVTAVPRAPAALIGIAEHGREVVPVLDLSGTRQQKAWRSVVFVNAAAAGKNFLLGFAAEQVETAGGSPAGSPFDAPGFAPQVVDLGGGRHANLINIAAVIEVFCMPSL